MPRLQDRVVRKNQTAIEEVALRLFIRQGFFGTSIRDIARAAGISVGNIYNYYPNKEALYVSLARRYAKEMSEKQARLKPLLGRFDPDSLRELARAAREIVYHNPDYWRLMYVDVTEFGNRHFANSFRGLAKKLEKLAGGYQNGLRAGIDAPLAFAAIYLQFFTYFLIEKLFGGRRHLGQPDAAAVEQMIRIFREGVSVRETDAQASGENS
ncbi:MAG TPA: TetR/AcrR family transcriptional regulator [Bryobacteraceae bacterium]|nr:TetR/AcrR family transcriptional regulator [Bryobacteraceae bacterium]